MAAFTHLNPLGSRFSDGTYGVFYAARDRRTAIAETKYHHGRFMAATNEAPITVQMRLLSVNIDATLHDLRQGHCPEALNPDSYAASQALARQLRAQGSAGIGYPSVRNPAGECVALFKPRGASQCLHAAHLLYEWNGRDFENIFEKID